MHHLTAVKLLLHAKNSGHPVRVYLPGGTVQIDDVERVIVSSKELRLVSHAGLEGVEGPDSLKGPDGKPLMGAGGEIEGHSVVVVGHFRRMEETSNEFKHPEGVGVFDTDCVSAIVAHKP